MKRGLRVRLATDSRALRYSGLVFQRDDRCGAERDRARPRAPWFASPIPAITLAVGTGVALNLMRRLRPAAVVGFGGYPTLPPLLAAKLAGIPGIIHEANAVLGRATGSCRAGSRRSQPRFRCARSRSGAGFKDDDGRHADASGDPRGGGGELCRAGTGGAVSLAGGRRQSGRAGGWPTSCPARSMRLEPSRWSRLILTQQVREEDMARVRRSMTASWSRRIWRRSSLICRRSWRHIIWWYRAPVAGTVAELGAVGRPSILVPFAGVDRSGPVRQCRRADASGRGLADPASRIHLRPFGGRNLRAGG